jgi:hypothetical protein
MNSKLCSLLCVCACLIGLNAALWGQSAPTVSGIRGYLDPRTGIFHSLAQMTPQDEEPATSTFAGKFVFNFTITISSTISTSVKIACAANATLEDVATTNFILESAEVTATRSGSTATCTVNIPYSWKLGSAPTDRVTLTYQITAPVEATGTAVLPSRTSQQTVGVISVPANGVTTTETVTATI